MANNCGNGQRLVQRHIQGQFILWKLVSGVGLEAAFHPRRCSEMQPRPALSASVSSCFSCSSGWACNCRSCRSGLPERALAPMKSRQCCPVRSRRGSWGAPGGHLSSRPLRQAGSLIRLFQLPVLRRSICCWPSWMALPRSSSLRSLLRCSSPVGPLIESHAIDESAAFGFRLWTPQGLGVGRVHHRRPSCRALRSNTWPITTVVLMIAAASGLLGHRGIRASRRTAARQRAGQSGARAGIARCLAAHAVSVCSSFSCWLSALARRAMRSLRLRLAALGAARHSKWMIGILWGIGVWPRSSFSSSPAADSRASCRGSSSSSSAAHAGCALDGDGLRSGICWLLVPLQMLHAATFALTHLGTLLSSCSMCGKVCVTRPKGSTRRLSAGLFMMLATAAFGPGLSMPSPARPISPWRRMSLLRGCARRDPVRDQPQSARGGGCMRLPSKRMPGERSCFSSSGPSRSTTRANWREQHGRRHGERRRQHAADHDLEILRLSGAGQSASAGSGRRSCRA